jgi:hypothetical protein
MIYEYGEPWWNDIDRGIFLIRPPELSGNPNSSHLVANEELEKEIMNLAFEVPSVMLRSDFFHAVKSYDIGGDSGFTSP